MAWDDKALKKNGLKPKFKIDKIDEEAMRQGDARSYFKQNEIDPKTLGRRISKEGRKADGYAKTADLRATTNLVADTAAIAKRIVTKPLNLTTR